MKTPGIYVQVPFCQTKCTYCNFHTGVVSAARFAPYVQCVCEEMARHREFYAAAGVGVTRGRRRAGSRGAANVAWGPAATIVSRHHPPPPPAPPPPPPPTPQPAQRATP